jgi:hypothetical protein
MYLRHKKLSPTGNAPPLNSYLLLYYMVLTRLLKYGEVRAIK